MHSATQRAAAGRSLLRLQLARAPATSLRPPAPPSFLHSRTVPMNTQTLFFSLAIRPLISRSLRLPFCPAIRAPKPEQDFRRRPPANPVCCLFIHGLKNSLSPPCAFFQPWPPCHPTRPGSPPQSPLSSHSSQRPITGPPPPTIPPRAAGRSRRPGHCPCTAPSRRGSACAQPHPPTPSRFVAETPLALPPALPIFFENLAVQRTSADPTCSPPNPIPPPHPCCPPPSLLSVCAATQAPPLFCAARPPLVSFGKHQAVLLPAPTAPVPHPKAHPSSFAPGRPQPHRRAASAPSLIPTPPSHFARTHTMHATPARWWPPAGRRALRWVFGCGVLCMGVQLCLEMRW